MARPRVRNKDGTSRIQVQQFCHQTGYGMYAQACVAAEVGAAAEDGAAVGSNVSMKRGGCAR
jgi:hypothetical protein